MPGTLQDGNAKRKRPSILEKSRKRARSRSSSNSDDSDDGKERIFALEAAVLESKKNYNNISTLVEFLGNRDDIDTALAAAVALCRIYTRLLAAGALRKSPGLSDNEVLVMQWLRARLTEYKEGLLPFFTDAEAALTALTLSMRLLKAESSGLRGNADYRSPDGHLLQIVRALLQEDVEDGIRREFVENFVLEFDDVRFYTFKSIKYAM
jgi:U3 small nucleolar RNA-associated protein 19